MCIQNNCACAVLPKNLCQPYARNDLCTQNILEHSARTNSRKLIHIPNENDMRARENCRQKMLRQYNVHHGHFVQNNDICFKRCLIIAGEADLPLRSALRLKHSMHCDGRMPRCLRQPLCGTSRRCTEQDLQPLCAQDVNHAADDCRLSRPRASCQNEDSMGQRSCHRFPLLCGKGHKTLYLPLSNEKIRIIHVDMFCLLLQES